MREQRLRYYLHTYYLLADLQSGILNSITCFLLVLFSLAMPVELCYCIYIMLAYGIVIEI